MASNISTLSTAQAKLNASAAKLAKFHALNEEQKAKWEDEIKMLETRVVNETAEITLGNGQKLTIRVCLSDAEMDYLAALEKERKDLDVVADKDKVDEITFKILELILANPIMTADWLKEHRAQFSTQDMLTAMMGFMAQITERSKAVSGIESFRPQ